MRTTLKQQIDLTIKLLVILLSGQKTTPAVAAKSLGVSVAWVFDMTKRLRDAGLHIAYDQREKRYSVGLTEEMAQGFIPKLSSRLNRAMKQKGLALPPTRFVSSLDRYTKEQFAQYLGVTAQNVQNMIAGYGGQTLPEGWIAFRLSEGGRWLIQKMPTDRTGKKYRIPENVAASAVEYKIGTNAGMKVKGPKPVDFSTCVETVDGKVCGNTALAHFLCHKHYWRVLRRPRTEGKRLLREMRSRKENSAVIADLQKWIHRRTIEVRNEREDGAA